MDKEKIVKKNSIISFWYSSFFSFIFIFIILLSYCSFPHLPSLSTVIKYLSLTLSIVSFIIYILTSKYSKFIIILFIYSVFLIISTLLSNTGSLNEFFKIYCRVISLSCYLDYGLKNYTKTIINSLFWTLYLLILVNFCTIIIFPKGLYSTSLYTTNWFFGYDNTHIFMYLPAIILLFCTKNIQKINGILLLAIITFCVFHCFSANSVVAYSIFLLYAISYKFVEKSKILNIKTYFLTYIALFALFVKLRIQNIFSWFIVDILHKTLTFSTRTVLWDKVESFIMSRPILGYGQEPSSTIIAKFESPYYTHAHNTFLDVLYKGGLVGLIFHICLMILPCRKLYKYKDYFVSKITSMLLFATMVMMIFEARQEKIGLYLALIVSYYIGSIIMAFKHEKEFKPFKAKKNDEKS